ncbi:uncharacterized protein EAE98_007634 [Botrytis deweyae]|uniref:Uncharacterized protein n=1 Tax=Botrytis deweyae TaxID=2478750 RepID=A0ABQ7IGU6_9HELO|nr:uncharacterized protein EAE98_007634 [Botrytis deweyae]KAF7923816.1 hypothetical protein EAE98_007634 [Botrytis deweyae]
MVSVVSALKMSCNVKMIRDKTVGRVSPEWNELAATCQQSDRPLPFTSPKRRKLSQTTLA